MYKIRSKLFRAKYPRPQGGPNKYVFEVVEFIGFHTQQQFLVFTEMIRALVMLSCYDILKNGDIQVHHCLYQKKRSLSLLSHGNKI